MIFKVLDSGMLGVFHLVIRSFIVVKNSSQGVIIHLPIGKINVIYIYIYIYTYILYIYIYIYIHIFDVTMGSYHGAEVCELSGIFTLSLTGNNITLTISDYTEMTD